LLWDIATGEPIRRFEEHTGVVRDVAFSPDGKLAVSSASDQTLIIWDVATGQALRRFTGHAGGVNGVAFTPDGKSILSASRDNTLRLWRVDSLEELISWTKAHRYIPELSCDERKRYGLEETCQVVSSSSTP
jgi:WD40 repeat protein